MTVSDHDNRKYSVVEYDPQWVNQFKDDVAKLRPIFGDKAIAIEHIGSTSVPGLAGKPTIDVLILVRDVADADQLNDAMERAGYHPLGDYIGQGGRLFVRELDSVRLCNVHVFRQDDPHVIEMLQMRDYLRTHPEVVAEYSQLKLDLVSKYPHDYGTYRKYKDAWMAPLKIKIKAYYQHL